MASKSKKSTKKQTKSPKSIELINKINHLNILIGISLNQLKKDGSVMDTIFKDQANRLYTELKKLEESK